MSDPQHVLVRGRRLACVTCSADTFEERRMTLNTSGVADSGVNKRGDLAVCRGCGYVHAFLGADLEWGPA